MKGSSVKRDRYIEARTVMGMEPVPAARRAGYADPNRGYHLEKHDPVVKRAMEKAQKETREMAMFTRQEAINKLLDAFNVAKTQDDATAMIRAVAELNKMHGYYEAEKKQLDVNVNHEHTLNPRQLQQLDTDQLLAKIGGHGGLTIEEAEYEEVETGSA